MLTSVLVFGAALAVLLTSARFFTQAAEVIGAYFKLPAFVIGIFIVGIGTSLPELVSSILAVRSGNSEIVPGNIIGSSVANLLLITGVTIALSAGSIRLTSEYIRIDLHFLVGAALAFLAIAYDGRINLVESLFGLAIFVIYSVYLIRGGTADVDIPDRPTSFPWGRVGVLVGASVGIYFGADYTVQALTDIAANLNVPKSLVALTALSLGTTLPEIAVNVSAVRRGNPELAIGNVLGSSVFNILVIPAVAASVGSIAVPSVLIGFALPALVATVVLFYLLAQDRTMSKWEGYLFISLYGLFLAKTAGF
jgi:cation:H+ antiporter